MRQDRYQIARNAVVHAELLIHVATNAISTELLDSEQDRELTCDIYKMARSAEALADTLADNNGTLDDAEGQGRR
jgi:hypothetical protein